MAAINLNGPRCQKYFPRHADFLLNTYCALKIHSFESHIFKVIFVSFSFSRSIQMDQNSRNTFLGTQLRFLLVLNTYLLRIKNSFESHSIFKSVEL